MAEVFYRSATKLSLGLQQHPSGWDVLTEQDIFLAISGVKNIQMLPRSVQVETPPSGVHAIYGPTVTFKFRSLVPDTSWVTGGNQEIMQAVSSALKSKLAQHIANVSVTYDVDGIYNTEITQKLE